MADAHDTLANLFERLDVAVHCGAPNCWRSGGTLDGPAFTARYGGGYSTTKLFRLLRCRVCGGPGRVSLIHALNFWGQRLPFPAGPRIQPPAK